MSATDPRTESKRFRKKPIKVDAVQLTRENANEILTWICDDDWHAELIYGPLADWLGISIFTLEGTMEAAPGDWIICGVEGEFYPCKPSIFDATYERADAVDTRVQQRTDASVEVPRRWIDEVVLALDAARTINERSLRTGRAEALHLANHDRLIAEAASWSPYASERAEVDASPKEDA